MLFYLPPLRRQAAALLQGAAQLFGVRWLGSALVGGDFVAATWLRRSQIWSLAILTEERLGLRGPSSVKPQERRAGLR